MGLPPPRLGQHLVTYQQAELDAHARKSDSLSGSLRAGGNVMVPCQLPTLHPAAVVHHRQRRLHGVCCDDDPARARVQRVGNDLGENRLFQRAWVRVTQVLQEVKQVNASFAHSSPCRCSRRRGTLDGLFCQFKEVTPVRDDHGLNRRRSLHRDGKTGWQIAY